MAEVRSVATAVAHAMSGLTGDEVLLAVATGTTLEVTTSASDVV